MEDQTDTGTLMCMTVASFLENKLPLLPGSKFAKCQDCSQEVIVAPSGLETLQEYPLMKVMCQRCSLIGMIEAAMHDPEFNGFQLMSPEQEAELLAAGQTPEEVQQTKNQIDALNAVFRQFKEKRHDQDTTSSNTDGAAQDE